MDKESTKIVDNLEINEEEDFVIVSVNPKIYPLHVVYPAAYVLLDDAYIFIEGDPNEEIIVKLKRKNKSISLEELGRKFNNELINYAVYFIQEDLNRSVREAIIQKALSTHEGEGREK